MRSINLRHIIRCSCLVGLLATLLVIVPPSPVRSHARLATVAGSASKVCHPTPPDFPGCSSRQIRSLLPRTPRVMVQRFRANQYGKFNLRTKKLSPRVNRHMRVLWVQAAGRYKAKDLDLRIPSWFQFRTSFKQNMCVAMRGSRIGSACVPNPFWYTGHGLQRTLLETRRITLRCGGQAFYGAIGGAVAGREELLGMGAVPGALGGAVGNGTLCAAKSVGDRIYGFFR